MSDTRAEGLFFLIFPSFRHNIHDVTNIAVQCRANLHENIRCHALVLAEFRQRNRTDSRSQPQLL